MGFVNLGLAALDLTGAGALVKGLTVGTMRFAARRAVREAYKNSANWNQMRRGLQRAGEVTRNRMSTPRRDWETTDHIFIKRRRGLPHWITNHPANLQTGVPLWLNSKFETMSPLVRALYLPLWMKGAAAGAVSYGAGLIAGSGEGCECR